MLTIRNCIVVITCVLAISQPAHARAPRTSPLPDPSLSAAISATPNAIRGQIIFKKRCAQCHQSDAYGSGKQSIPALAGQQYEYLVKQLVDLVDFERANGTMHAVLIQSGVSNTQSIADVAGYAANLPMNPSPDKGDGLQILLGQKIFDGSCISCHDKHAEGNAELWIPNLRGQHYEYLLKQMHTMADGSRNNISEDVHRVFTIYAPSELEAVTDYISRMTGM